MPLTLPARFRLVSGSRSIDGSGTAVLADRRSEHALKNARTVYRTTRIAPIGASPSGDCLG